MDDKYYTAGEIARIAGVSLRTIRYYDAKGLLPPVSHSDTGYRLYDKGSLSLLQRILMLKYLGFSLEEIQKLVAAQEADDLDQEAILDHQKKLLLERRQQLEQLISTIELAQKSPREDKWQILVRCLNLLTSEEKVLEQYQNPDNLQHRINIHTYSTSSQGWMDWVYERLALEPGETVLELGCGTGLLWMERPHLLPEGLQLTLTDRSREMLEQTRQNLAPHESELASRGVCVNAVAPGFIDTEMTRALSEKARESGVAAVPMGRMGSVEDIAEMVAFLAGNKSDYITGQVICVDGGMAI